MAIVIPKPYHLQHLLDWANDIKAQGSVHELQDLQKSAVDHGLSEHRELANLISSISDMSGRSNIVDVDTHLNDDDVAAVAKLSALSVDDNALADVIDALSVDDSLELKQTSSVPLTQQGPSAKLVGRNSAQGRMRT